MRGKGQERICRASGLRFTAVLAAVLMANWSVQAQQAPGSAAGGASQTAAGQTQGNASAKNQALDNQVLDEVDGEQNITYMESHVGFEYRYDSLDGGVAKNSLKLKWQQAIGETKRVAVRMELPFDHVSEPENMSTGGFGDMKLELRGMLQKKEKFEHAAGVEVTLPSANNYTLGEGQTVLRFIWGFSGQLTPKTVLSGEFAYNKAIVNHGPGEGENNIEPELILSQALAKRLGAYLDWDNYYEFSVDKYINTMKIGLEIALDKKEKWGFAPYVVLPLSHASSVFDTKVGAGFELTYAF